MSVRTTRERMHAYAQEFVSAGLRSSNYSLGTLAAFLGVKQGVTYFPGSNVPMTIGKQLSAGKMQEIQGGTQYLWPVEMTAYSASAWSTYAGTASAQPGTYANQGIKMPAFSWSQVRTGISLPNDDIDAHDGTYKLGNMLDDALHRAINDQTNSIAGKLYTGSPADQTADLWSDLLGLDAQLQSGNTIGGIDRSLAANAGYRGQYSTASLTASLKLLDDINLTGVDDGAAGTTTGLKTINSQADLVITTPTIYNKLKQEAVARSLTQVQPSSKLPEMGLVGFKNECFEYNGMTVTYDPKATATNLYVLDSSVIHLHFKSGKNFAASPFVDLTAVLPSTGQNDNTNSELVSKLRLVVEEPAKCFLGTNVA